METIETKKTYLIDPRDITVKEDFNARRVFDITELAEQIKNFGVKNPLKVKPYQTPDKKTKYELVDGERRYRAIMFLIAENVDCEATKKVEVQFSEETSRRDLLLTQILCNQGKPFTDYEYALWYTKMCHDEKGNKIMSYTEAAKLISKPAWHGALCSHIMELSPECQEAFKMDRINLATLRRLKFAVKDKMKKENPEVTKEEIEAAVENIMKVTLQNNPFKKKRLTSKDFDIAFRTSAEIDTITIRKGLSALKKYIDNYTSKGYTFSPNLNMQTILNELLKKEKENHIDVILEKYLIKKEVTVA